MPKIIERIPTITKLLMLFAIFVSITPEFTLFGIPKIRLTDLMLPILVFITITSSRLQGLPALLVCLTITIWDSICLFILGRAAPTPGVYYLFKRDIYFLILWIAFAYGRTGFKIQPVVYALLYSSPILGMTLITQQEDLHGDGEAMRASGIIKEQEGSTAYFFVVILSFVIALLPCSQKKTRLGLLAVLALGIHSLLATGTKGGVLFLAVAAFLLLLRNIRQALPIGLVLILFGALNWSTLPTGIQERFARLQSESATAWSGLTEGVDSVETEAGGDSVADRMVAARSAIKSYILESPIWGLGAGYRPLGFADDFYLSEWTYNGAVGLALWMCLQISLIHSLFRSTRRLKDPFDVNLCWGVLFVVISLSLAGFAADVFYIIRPCEALFLVIGLVLGRAQADVTTGVTTAMSRKPTPPEFQPRLRPSPPSGDILTQPEASADPAKPEEPIFRSQRRAKR